ncbi:MAG: hypothetical protein LBR72_02615 [Oscillospiraceae bacterium]|jgi:hypothetical protein|nr:hypothetical protein [Oscillospiraceae bacterium]
MAEKRDLRAFMRESSKTEEIITAPAPESFRDKDGNLPNLEIRALSTLKLKEIRDKFRSRGIAVDNKKNPLVANGAVVYKPEYDEHGAAMYILIEALQYPNLRDPELMAFYGCLDATEMPMRVFCKQDEFTYVNRVVMAALGLANEVDERDPHDIETEAKNS